MSDWKDEMRGERNTPEGNAKVQLYKRYYDISNTIRAAGATDPNNSDSQVYNVESIDDALQRNAPFINVCNDGRDNLYVLVSHGGTQTFSPENIIYPGDIKTYINVYELRLRSPTTGLPYRVSEYDIDRGCCPTSGTTVLPVRMSPIEKSTLQGVALPVANTNFFGTDIVPTNYPCAFIIQISLSVAGILYIVITNGGNTQVTSFDPLVPLAANELHSFGMLINSGDTMNIRYSVAGGIIQMLRIQEIDSIIA